MGDKRKGRKVLSRRKVNKFVEQENCYALIVESKGKNFEVIVDKEDYEQIKEYKWCLNTYGYAISERSLKENGNLFLHQLILGKKENKIIDHINQNILDNRKANLRYATKQTNAMNSKVIGISYRKDTNKWSAMIVVNKKRIMLGCYSDYDDALKARINGEDKYFAPIIKEVQNEN